jgi:hypothetical protein
LFVAFHAAPHFYFELIECFSYRVRVELIRIKITLAFDSNLEIENVKKIRKRFQALNLSWASSPFTGPGLLYVA